MCAAYGYKSLFQPLCVFGGFNQRVAVRAANHLMERGAGGDHGIDGVFLLDEEVDQERSFATAGGVHGGQYFGAAADGGGRIVVKFGELDEIRTEDGRGLVVLLVEELLPLADHAEVSIVDDGDVEVEVLLRDGGELGSGHLEAAVSGDNPDFLVGAGDLGSDGGGKSKAHGSESAGGDQRVRLFVLVVLCFPHLVLADVRDDDGLAVGGVPEIVHDVGGVEVPIVGEVLNVAHSDLALHGVDFAQPRGVAAGAGREVRQQGFEDFGEITDEGDLNLDVLVDLGGVDLDVNLLRVGRVGRERAGDAIVEAHAAGDEQIRLLDGVVDPGFAMHAHHAERERMRCGEAAKSEERGGYGDLEAFCERKYLLARSGLDHAVSGEDDRALGGADQLGGLDDRFGLSAEHGVRAIGAGRGGGEVVTGGGLLRVLGDVDEDGAGAARLRDAQRFANDRGDIFGTRDEVVVLGHGKGDAGDVDFLEGVGAEDLARDLSGNAEQRDGVHHGGGDAGDHVGGAGSGGGDGHADFA